MKVAAVQTKPVFGQVERNLEKAAELIRSAARADFYILPELFTTGYLFESREEVRELAEPAEGGPTYEALSKLARELDAVLVAGFAEKEGDCLYNSALVVSREGLVGVYRKTHLFLDEKDLFDPGDSGFRVFTCGGVKLGVLICFDWVFPEAARVLALAGAEILCHPSNLVLPYAQRAMRIRALENRVFTATANRVGADERAGKRLAFTGSSQITDLAGEVLAQASPDREEVILAEIDPSRARDKHFTARNDLFADRRPEFYERLQTRIG